MPKTLTLKTSKLIQDELKDIETEYIYADVSDDGNNPEQDPIPVWTLPKDFHEWANAIKAPTLEEAMEWLPYFIFKDGNKFNLVLYKDEFNKYCATYLRLGDRIGVELIPPCRSKTPIQALDKLIVYLKTNNLLGKK